MRRLPWLALLAFAPVLASFLLLSHGGRAWLDRVTARPEAEALLPGMTIENPPSRTGGPVVTSIRSGSEAAQGGMTVGDSIVALDGTPIFSLDQARLYLQKDRAGMVELSVVHGSHLRNVRLGRECA